MIAGGIVAAFLGVKAEGESLENIAKPLTAEDDAGRGPRPPTAARRRSDRSQRRSTHMPMPPPKPSTEGRRDRQVFHEMGQLVRAVEANGPTDPDQLATLVGAAYWEQDRFDRALALSIADGLLVRDRRRDPAGGALTQA